MSCSVEYFALAAISLSFIKLVQGHERTIPVNYVEIDPSARKEWSFYFIFYFRLWWPSCPVEWNKFSNKKNISVKLFLIFFLNQSTHLEKAVILFFISLFLALAAILFSKVEPF